VLFRNAQLFLLCKAETIIRYIEHQAQTAKMKFAEQNSKLLLPKPVREKNLIQGENNCEIIVKRRNSVLEENGGFL